MKHIEETNLKLESEKQLKNCEDMHIWVQPIKNYIKELEAKEERAKKVEELLRLHKYYTDYNLFPSKVVERIKQLEEEMK